MKYVIVGGGGFVGSWLTHELTSRNHDVHIIDPLIFYSDWDAHAAKIISKFKKDILLKGATVNKIKFQSAGKEILQSLQPDVVIHLAGIPLEKVTDIPLSTKQLTDDIALTYKIINSVKQMPIKKFIFMSSISAYGDCPEIVREDNVLLPKTPYGISKASGEFLVRAELSNWNIIRTTNIYGFGDMNSRAHNLIMNKAIRGEKFWVNKGFILDFIHVRDLVAGIADVAEKGQDREVFHISGGSAVGLTKFVKELSNYFTLDYEVKVINDRPKRGTMDNTKARQMIGWSPKMDMKTGIADYISFVKKYGIA